MLRFLLTDVGFLRIPLMAGDVSFERVILVGATSEASSATSTASTSSVI